MITGFHWDTTLPDTHMHTKIVLGRVRLKLPPPGWSSTVDAECQCDRARHFRLSSTAKEHKGWGIYAVILRIDGVIVFCHLLHSVVAWIYCFLDIQKAKYVDISEEGLNKDKTHKNKHTSDMQQKQRNTQAWTKNSVAILGFYGCVQILSF